MRNSGLLRLALSQIENNMVKAPSCAWARARSPIFQSIPTGSLALDAALGVGGMPRGRIVEIYGPEASRQDDAGSACDCFGAARWR